MGRLINISFLRTLLFLAISGFCQAVTGQVLINEFSASNSTIIEDPDYNDFADWIELYNTGTEAVNLKGWHITDNFDLPGKWQITQEAFIHAGGYLLIWTDDRDSGLHASFKLSALGEQIAVYSPDLVLVDSISFGEQRTDISCGRMSDGDAVWGYFAEPTPGASNNTQSYQDFTSSLPEFSVRGGMYTVPFFVALHTDFGGEIRFTTDGSDPAVDDPLYASPIPINSTTILRARIFQAGLIPGPVVTHSYFIHENSEGGELPVVSIATDPANLWDPETGIYVQNFKPLWEVPINIELFENDGGDRAAFNETAGAQINGLYSWQLPQKMLGIYFKKQYGPANLDYPMIRQRKRSSYKNFALRASGSDWSYTLFRDMLGQHATLLNMNIDIMGFRPSVAYFNGEYMGIHNIREKVDDDYIEKSYNMEPGSFDLVENEDYPEAGDLAAYNALLALLEKDLSIEENFSEVAGIVDLENFTDLIITELATGNTSISHNVMAWKPKGYGKWRWILMDLDRGFFNPNSNLTEFYLDQEELPFTELMQNQSYRNSMAKKLTAHLFSTFHPERMKQLIDEHMQDIDQEVPRHITRWQGTTSSYGDAIPSVEYWENEVGNLKTFVRERPVAVLTDFAELYDLEGVANLSLLSFPEDAGFFTIENMTIPASPLTGPCLKGISLILEAVSRPGYTFSGWATAIKETLVPSGALWKYLDAGIDPGPGWMALSFNDNAWQSGNTEMGYGDGDENTVVSYGGVSSDKYITTYFRTTFTVSLEQLITPLLVINLLKDDGAIVYLNGTEVIRANMDYGNTGYLTTAASSVNGDLESAFTPYQISGNFLREGENILAVEVHQRSGNSSDLSFDLEFYGLSPDLTSFVSLQSTLPVNLTGDLAFTAVYSKTNYCVIPTEIHEDLTLGIDCSPYLAQGDITIEEQATLTIEPGVEVWMPEGATLYVNGILNTAGTAESGITFKLNPDFIPGKWGIISFRNTPMASSLSYVTIEDASMGFDPVTETGAISAFNANLILDHLTLKDNYGNPVMARYSNIRLTNSFLHSGITGDLINVKYGEAYIENCRFVGNDQPDTDAIDYDETRNGIIRNCHISDLLGFNSDAIDIGEEAENVLIDSIFVYNVTDKGVSVGQKSSASVRNSIFVFGNMGIGVKDSAHATVNRCVFYGTVNPVKCFEKNLGLAGGNVRVFNSILSNSPDGPFYADSKSSIDFYYSMADEQGWSDHPSNLTGNPLFANPTFSDFDLLPGSPAIEAGLDNGTPVNMGTSLPPDNFIPPVMIYQIFINGGAPDLPEFLTLYNPSPKLADLSGWIFTKGITFTFPEETYLNPGDILYLTNDAQAAMWQNKNKQVLQWQSGRLADEGETLQVSDRYGIVKDYLKYENNGFWPEEIFSDNLMLQLKDIELDNHFPESWEVKSVDPVINAIHSPANETFSIYPNPALNWITVRGYPRNATCIEIFNITGQPVDRIPLYGQEQVTIDLSQTDSEILFIRCGEKWVKIVRIK